MVVDPFSESIKLILVVIVGTLLGIIYSLRVLVLMERRIARVDENIEKLVQAILKEEKIIEESEKRIEKKLSKK